MIAIPAGDFIYGGPGDPPAQGKDLSMRDRLERVIPEPAFSIDRTEVTNAAFDVLVAMEPITGIGPRPYPPPSSVGGAAAKTSPVSFLNWHEARAYCRFLGKQLPTSEQWVKAMRGGLALPDGPNPGPRRNLPWGQVRQPVPARIGPQDPGERGPAPVGTSGDVSPYGVHDLAGNVSEWTETLAEQIDAGPARGVPVTRGGNWGDVTPQTLADYMSIENQRADLKQDALLGMRCASRP
jgi:formylglycine-generating enzyme required for sulfatase activity